MVYKSSTVSYSIVSMRFHKQGHSGDRLFAATSPQVQNSLLRAVDNYECFKRPLNKFVWLRLPASAHASVHHATVIYPWHTITRQVLLRITN